MKFKLGRLLATPVALEAILEAGENPATYIDRHAAGDWGEVCADDRKANEDALVLGERLLSAYSLKSDEKIWIITEADRSATTVLTPAEY